MKRLLIGLLFLAGCGERAPDPLWRVTLHAESGSVVKSWLTKNKLLFGSKEVPFFEDAETGRRVEVVVGRGTLVMEPEVPK